MKDYDSRCRMCGVTGFEHDSFCPNLSTLRLVEKSGEFWDLVFWLALIPVAFGIAYFLGEFIG